MYAIIELCVCMVTCVLLPNILKRIERLRRRKHFAGPHFLSLFKVKYTCWDGCVTFGLSHHMQLPTVSVLTNKVFSLLAEVAFSLAADDIVGNFMREEGRGGTQPQENLPSSNSTWKNKAGLN